MSTEDAHACWAMADRIARAARAAGDDRPLGMLRAQAVRERILGPDGETPHFSADVTVLAPLDALEKPEPGAERAPVGHVGGQPVTAAHLRELLDHHAVGLHFTRATRPPGVRVRAPDPPPF
jgi:hypothetical protein